MTTELCDIMRKHGSDKALGGRPGKKCHDYTLFYHELFHPMRFGVRSLCEVGIFKGASLRGWAEFFPNAVIVGLDIDPDRLINDGRIVSKLCDQTDRRTIWAALATHRSFNIVIDDGLHTPQANVEFFTQMWPRTECFHVVEDVKAKYLDETLAGMKAAHPDANIEVVDRTYPGSKKDNRLIVARR